MDLNNTTMLSTPQKLPGDPEELAMIENLENELNTLADCLEKSNDKVRVQMRKIQEQEENSKLRNLIDKHMKNFACFTTEMNKNIALEAENVSLHTRLDVLTTETHDKIIDLELEKDRLQKEVQTLEAQSKKHKEETSNLKKEFASLNQLIKENFEKTLTYKHTVEIQDLNQSLEEKNKEIASLKSNFEKEKEALEKELKQKKLELDLVRIDYQSAVMTTLHSKPINQLKDHKLPELTGGRKSRQAKQKTIENIKKHAVNSDLDSQEEEEEFYNPEESNDEAEEEEADEEEEEEHPRKGKRKATKAVKPKENKRVKKNENKDLMLASRNTIQYHLFN